MFFKRKESNLRDEAKNVIDSISMSKNLYKELIKIAHPDKHHPSKQKVATEITELLNEHKYNLKELQLLKKRISNELE